MIRRKLIRDLFQARQHGLITEIKVNRGTIQVIFPPKISEDKLVEMGKVIAVDNKELIVKIAHLDQIGESSKNGKYNTFVLCIADEGYDPFSTTCVWARSAQDAENFFHRVGSRNQQDYKCYLKYTKEIEDFMRANIDYELWLKYDKMDRVKKNETILVLLKNAFEDKQGQKGRKLRDIIITLEEK